MSLPGDDREHHRADGEFADRAPDAAGEGAAAGSDAVLRRPPLPASPR